MPEPVDNIAQAQEYKADYANVLRLFKAEKAMGRPKIRDITYVATKRCSDCKMEKPRDEFYPNPRNTKYGLSSHCRQCNNERNIARAKLDVLRERERKAAWDRRNREQIKDARRRRVERNPAKAREQYRGYKWWTRLRITAEDYNKLLEEQGGRCAICRSDKVASKKSKQVHFHIDHDHIDGRVRGLLCMTCNLGIGAFQDNPEFLRAAIAYLERPKPLILRGG